MSHSAPFRLLFLRDVLLSLNTAQVVRYLFIHGPSPPPKHLSVLEDVFPPLVLSFPPRSSFSILTELYDLREYFGLQSFPCPARVSLFQASDSIFRKPRSSFVVIPP